MRTSSPRHDSLQAATWNPVISLKCHVLIFCFLVAWHIRMRFKAPMRPQDRSRNSGARYATLARQHFN